MGQVIRILLGTSGHSVGLLVRPHRAAPISVLMHRQLTDYSFWPLSAVAFIRFPEAIMTPERLSE